MNFAHGAIQWLAADAATTVYTVSGLSFQPKALRFYWQGLGSATDTASQTTHSRRGVGFATGTADRRCVGSQDRDAASSAICTTGYRTDCVAMTLTSTPAADGLLDLNSITSDGFTLIVDGQAPVDITVFWEAWGGADITNAATGEIAEPAATGNVDYTVTDSFQPDVVMFAGVQATGAAPTAARNDSGLCVGFASGGAAAENAVLVGNSDDGSGTMDTDAYALDGECLAMIVVGGGNPNARAQMTQFNADGFRLNWIARATTGRKSIYLSIKGGAWRVGSYTIDASTTNATATVSGLPVQPIGLCLMTGSAGESAAGISYAFDLFSLGTGSSPTSRRSMSHVSENGTAYAEIDLAVEYDQVLVHVGGAGAVYTAFDINAINSDGFQIIVDLGGAGEQATEWQGYLAFGSAGGQTFTESPVATFLLLPSLRDIGAFVDRPAVSSLLTPVTKDIGAFVETTVSPALSFDGLDDYVSIPYHAALATDTFTLEAWVYLLEAPRQQVVVGRPLNYFMTWDGTPVEEGQAPKFRVQFRNAAGTAYRGIPQDGGETYVLPLRRWTHLAGTFGGSGSTIRLYANGVLVSETNIINENTNQDNFALLIGRWDGWDADHRLYWGGFLDEVRVWNFARSQADIQRDMSSRLSGSESGLVGYWRLNELEGSTAVDATGNMDGTIIGAVRTTRPLLGFSVDAAPRDATSLVDSPGITATVSPSIKDIRSLIEKPGISAIITPAVLGLQTMVDRPGVGAVLTAQEQDTASLVERPGTVLGILSSEKDFRSLVERPGITALLVPDIRDLAALRDAPDTSIVILPGVLGLQTMLEKPGASLSFTPTAKDIGAFVEIPGRPALRFDGTDDKVEIPDSPVFDLGSALTAEVWVAPSNPGAIDRDRTIFKDLLMFVQVGFGDGTRDFNDRYIRFAINLNNVWHEIVSPIGTVDWDIWQHFACVYDGVAAWLYKNGILIPTVPISGSGALTTGNTSLFLGALAADNVNTYRGQLYDVRLWGVARTVEQIRENMHRRLLGDESGLVGYWKIDEGSGTRILDSTPNANHGSITDAVWSQVPWIGLPLFPSVKDTGILVDRLTVPAVITPAVLGLQTMVDKPGVGAVITAQEADTAILVERPSLVAALQSAVSDVASLIDRPLSTVVVSPAVSDRMSAVDVALATLSLVPQALSVAVFKDGPQIGIIVILPTVTDVFVGGAETFDEVVTITETIIASVLDRLTGIDRPSVTVTISPAVLGLQTMEDRPGIGTVLVVQERDTASLVERPAIAESLAPSVRDAAAFVDRPGITAVLSPGIRDLLSLTESPGILAMVIPSVVGAQTMVDRPAITAALIAAMRDAAVLVDRPSVVSVLVPDIRDLASLKETPGIIAALIGSERDAAVFQDRPSLSAVLQAAVRDVASLVDRPLTSFVLTPSVAASITAVDAALMTLMLVPQAVSVAAFIERQQIGIIVVLPSVTDALIGAGQTFDEIVTITETILASVLDRLVGVDRPSAVMAISPAVLGIQTMVDKPGISAVLVPAARDFRVLMERPAVVSTLAPGVADLHSMTERPSAVVAVSLSALGLQTMQEQPGVGAVLVIQERDTASLIDRPGAVLGVSPGVGDFRTLVERPSVTAALQPSVSDVAALVETASAIFALVPQAASVAVLRDNPQIGVVIVLPGVTDVFIGAEGPQVFSETVTIIETIIASVSDQLVGIERPAAILVVSGAVDEALVEFLAGRMGRRIVVVDAQGRILTQRDRGDILTRGRNVVAARGRN